MEGWFTMPGETGWEDYTMDLASRWNADVIRDCDGTELSEKILTSGYRIYSTICIIRGHNPFAAAHPETVGQVFLSTPETPSWGTTLVLPLLFSFSSAQFSINETDAARSYMEVWDRSDGVTIPRSSWSYCNGSVTIKGTKEGHLYSASFLAYRIWEVISMYNQVTNSLEKEHLKPIDPRYPVAREYLLNYLDSWCASHPHTDVVRFTSLFYNFAWIWGSRGENLFTDWASYDFTVSEKALDDFEKEYGYALTAEDFINKGRLQPTHMPPTAHKRDWMDFTMRFVSSLAREMVAVVHGHHQKAYVFYDDSWVGLEPWGSYFPSIGFDGLIKCVFSGFEVRLCSGANVPVHELRLHPYLFPVGLGGKPTFSKGGHPERDAVTYWLHVRRALLRCPIDRLGVGGYVHLVHDYPAFADAIESISKEFKAIHDLTATEKPVAPLGRIAVLHTWGRLRSWTLSGHFHETSAHDLIHINEALSGLPVQVDFIDAEDAKKDLSPYRVVINAGRMGDAWSGGDMWKESALVTAIRRFVEKGGVFLGVDEPSAYEGGKATLALSDVLGIDIDKGWSSCHCGYPLRKEENDIVRDGNTFREKEHAVVVSPDVSELAAGLTVHPYGKGKGIWMSHFDFSYENAAMLERLLFFAEGIRMEDVPYMSDNPLCECAYYPGARTLVIINNSMERESCSVMTDAGARTFDLEGAGIRCETV